MRFYISTLAALIVAAPSLADPKPILRVGTDAFRTPAPMYCSAFSPDGKLLAVGTTNILFHPHVIVFDAATGRPLHRFKGFGHVVREVSFSPDGKLLVTANGDNSLALYDLAANKLKWQLMNTASDCAQFLPDGKTIAAERGSAVVLVNSEHGQLIRTLTGPTKRVHRLRAADAGDFLAGASEDGTITVWDVKTGDVAHTLQAPAKYAVGLAFSADGARLAAAGYEGDYVAWDLKTGKQLWNVMPENSEAGGPLTFSADGKVVVGLRRGGGVFDAATGKGKSVPKNMAPHHGGGVSADRTRFAPVFSDHVARIVAVGTGELIVPVEGHAKPPTAVAFTEGGKGTVTASMGDLCSWDATTGRLANRVTAMAEKISVSPDGRRFVSVGTYGELAVRDAETLKEVQGIGYVPVDSIRRDAITMHVGPDAFYLSSRKDVEPYGWDKTPTPLKTFRGDRRIFDGGEIAFTPFAVAPDGRSAVIAVIAESGPQLVWWDFVAGKVTRSQPNGQAPKAFDVPIESSIIIRTPDYANSPVSPRAFLSDGRHVVAESDEGFLLLRADTGERVRLLCSWGKLATSQSIVGGGYVQPSIPFAVSPDGRLLAVGQAKGIRLVETATGEIRKTFDPGERIGALAFSPDGRRIASTWEHPAALVWDVYDGEPLNAAAVIAQAEAISPAKAADSARIRAWLTDLDAPKYAVREAAQAELAKLDTDAMPIIEAHLKTSGLSPEATTRTEKARVVLRAVPLTPDRRRAMSTLEMLERLNTPAARREMARLAAGEPGCALTVDAAESLKRMERAAK